MDPKNNVADIYPLSPMQEGILFHSLLAPEDGMYLEQLSCTLDGELDVDAFERSWQCAIDRHCVLRTGFYWERRDKPFQVVFQRVSSPWVRQSWSGFSPPEQEALRESFLREDRRRPFDLSSRPLMRLVLVDLGRRSHFFVWSFHHLLLDGWSVPVVLREVFACYETFRLGRELQLEPPRLYRSYISWLGRQDLSRAEAFWRSTLSGFRAPTTISFSRPWEDSGRVGDREGERVATLPQPAMAALKAAVREHQVTLNSAVQSAWALLLGLYSGERDIVFGCTVSGRPADLPGVDSMVGLFINTLPVRLEISGGEPLVDLWRRSHARQVETRHYDYAPLVDIHGWSEVPRGLPLFESLVVFENYPVDTSLRKPSGSLAVCDVRFSERANFPLILIAEPTEELRLRVLYNGDRFDAPTISRLLGHLGCLLTGFAACLEHPELVTAAIPMLAAAEHQQIIIEWNDTRGATGEGACLHELFELRCLTNPEAVAVVGDDLAWTYGEVNRKANRMAHLLRQLEVGPGILVAVQLERCSDMVPVLLSILKAGGAYVPLEASWPRARVEWILTSIGVRHLMTQSALLERLAGEGTLPGLGHVISIDRAAESTTGNGWLLWQPHHLETLPSENPSRQAEVDDLAYVIFTSGSTGTPKGVLVRHRPVLNLIEWVNGRFSIGTTDRVLCVASLCFDLSVYDIFGLLAAGGSIRVVSSAELEEPEVLARILCSESITFWDSAPVVLHQLVPFFPVWREEAEPNSLRLVFLSGDWIPLSLPGEVRASFPQAEVISLGGATEATVWSNVFPVRQLAPSWVSIPYGRPIFNAEYHVLDRDGEVCPIGVAGDLYIGGSCLSSGYCGEPALTASKYLPDPFGSAPGAILYKTGDRARYWPDGNLEFLGRFDHQVKIRGFRIELGEIEACLGQHPYVADAVVVVREDDPGQRRLVAYVIPAAGAAPETGALRSWLQERLPLYMVPAAFLFLAGFPVTANGKLDRRALPAPGELAAATAPRPSGNLVEEMISGVWAEVLGRESVNPRDDFFEMGGHSLLATQLISRLRKIFRVDLALRSLFEAPTVETFAKRVTEARGESSATVPIVPVPRQSPLPLSFAQQRLWFLDRLEPGSPLYNIPDAVELDGRLDIAVLRASLCEVVRRHEALRTSFQSVAGEPVQLFTDSAEPALPVIDLRSLPDREREQEAGHLATAEARRPFDLGRGPLLRAALLKLGVEQHVALLTMHHIVSDGWSMGVLASELGALYTAFLEGRRSPLPELAVQYADFAAWQRRHLSGDLLESELAWWRGQLAGMPPVLELPTDRPRPPVQSFRGSSVPLELPDAMWASLRSFSRRSEGTLFITFLAAFQAMLSRYSGQQDLCVGTPIAGRNRMETEGLIGFFVNTVVLRGDLSRDPGFGDSSAGSGSVCSRLMSIRSSPFELLVEHLQPERSLSHEPLFQVVMDFHHRRHSLALVGLDWRSKEIKPDLVHFDLILTGVEGPAGLGAQLEYRTDLFDSVTVQRMLGHFDTLLAGAVEKPEIRLSELPLLSTAERGVLLAQWSEVESFGPRSCLHWRFEEQVRRSRAATAVVCGVESLSYGELDGWANRLAHSLQRRGVGPEVVVGICLERSLEMIVAVLAVLKAGGAYLPLDPAYPKDRLSFLLSDAAVPWVLTVRSQEPSLPTCRAGLIFLDEEAGRSGEDEGLVRSGAGPESLAYVIYTSGLTGRPRGVQVTHGNVDRLLNATESWFGFGPGDVWTLFHSFAFDFSVWETWGALAYGGLLVVVPYWVSRSPESFYRLLAQEGVTVLNQTPSAFRQLMLEEESGTSRELALRLVIFGGESLEIASLWPWVDRHGASHPQLVNMYGITETTVHVTYRPLSASEVLSGVGSRIGRPIPDLALRVLGWNLEPQPVGIPGELCVGGEGLARGYLGRPELTAERFVPDPWGREPGSRLYRSGDLGRRLEGGDIEYLGRIDLQVKVRGFRIELGEIEVALASSPGVREAVVFLREDEPGDQRLVAYVVLEPAGAPSMVDLRETLRTKLPEHMIPTGLVVLDALPLTLNGKLDRQALAQLQPERATEKVGLAPRTPAEELVAGIFAEVLGLERVGPEDDFFALGGHSLLATQVVSRVRNVFGVELPVRVVFEAPTVEGLADRLARSAQEGTEGGQGPALGPVSRTGPLATSFAQRRLWFLDRLEPGSPVYNIPAAVELTGRLDVAVLASALGEVVRRHESLRTTFHAMDEPVQIVSPVGEVALPVVDLQGLSSAAQGREAQRLAEAEARWPFDLDRGPLLRSTLLQLGFERHTALLTMHHIVSDGWSAGVLVRELGELYAAFLAGRPSPLPELAIQYADFAVWQRGDMSGAFLETELAWWRGQLLGMSPALELPADHPRAAVRSVRGAVQGFAIDGEVAGGLALLSRRQGATLFMTLLSGYLGLLHRYTGEDDLVLGTPIAGRTRVETEPLIGLFVNTLALRVDLSGDPEISELLARVREMTLSAYAHQEVPFERLVEDLAPQRDLSRPPLVQVLFVVQNAPSGRLDLPGLTLSASSIPTGTAKFELTCTLMETESGLEGTLEYSRDLFEASTIIRLAGHFVSLLAGAAGDPRQRLSELPLLSAIEQAQLLIEWNDVGTVPHSEGALHELFEVQANRTPEAVALVAGLSGERWTYRELDLWADSLALRLAGLGVGPEVRVGVCLSRTPLLVASLLAVLKAGGAYVPLDPAYPRERLAFLLEDSGAAVLLTEQSLTERLCELGAQLLLVDPAVTRGAQGGPAVESGVLPGNLAYLIYTSGLTGRPKGVAIEHRSAVAFARWARTIFPPEDLAGVLAATSVSFDLSVFELFVTLAWGGKVVLAADALELPRLAAAGEVVLVNTVPSAMAELVRLQAVPESVRTINLAGEPVKKSLVDAIYASTTAIRVLDLYGPSEATTYSTWSLAPRSDRREPSIGRPVAGTRAFVLDTGLRPVPAGVSGELFLGGAGLARGYLDRPELTAERFLPDPHGAPGERLYRTGDLVRHRPDGCLEFLGRRDHQVKVRGFRIETGEIEAALVRHPAVQEAVVIAAERGAAGLGLVAYVVPLAAGGETLRVDELRAFLEQILPAHLVPSGFVTLETIPRTPNGKMDRRALPAPERSRSAADGLLRTPLQEIVADAWAEVLGLPAVSGVDNFFDLGGHSLLATRVISRLQERLGVELSLRNLFQHPTVAALATDIERKLAAENGAGLPPIERMPRDGRPLLLSFAQERLWFFDRLEPGNPIYNVNGVFLFQGPLDAAALAAGLSESVRRHESLRTCFVEQGQLILPPALVELPRIDLRALPAAAREAESQRRAVAEARRPFDLRQGPLLRAVLIEFEEERHLVVVTLHHIACDGWSLNILIREVMALYTAFAAGRTAELPELPVQYADFAGWQRTWLQGDALKEQLAYWTRHLGGAPPQLTLPHDRPRPPRPSYRGGAHRLTIGPEVTADLRALGRGEGSTLFMTLLAAWALLLQRYSGQSDIVVGSNIANRYRRSLEGLIGLLANTVALRIDLSGDPSVRELLARARETVLGAHAHQDLPFEKLVEALRPERDAAYHPIFQVMLVLQEAAPRLSSPAGLDLVPVGIEHGLAKFDLTLFAIEEDGEITTVLEYDADLFAAETIADLAGQLAALLEILPAWVDEPISALSFLSVAQEESLQEAFTEDVEL